MKTKIILSALCCLGILFACERHDHKGATMHPPFAYMESYIAAFQPADEIHIRLLNDGLYAVDEQRKIIDRYCLFNFNKPTNQLDLKISFAPDNPDNHYKHNANGDIRILDLCPHDSILHTTSPDALLPQSEQFKALAEQIGDTSFDRRIYQNPEYLSVSLLDTIKTVTITCDKDFDTAHPAGSSMNDLFTVSFNDPLSLIRNNYQPSMGTYQYGDIGDNGHYNLFPLGGYYPYAVIREKLSDVNFLEHPYLDIYWDCILYSAPATTDTYTFTVKVVLENGKELQSSASIAIKGAEV